MEGSIAEVEEDAGAEGSPSTSISLTRSAYLVQVRVRSQVSQVTAVSPLPIFSGLTVTR
jgi:DNA helicase IV